MGGLPAGGFSPGFAERAGAAAQNPPDKLRGVQILVFDTFGTVVDRRSSVIAEGEPSGVMRVAAHLGAQCLGPIV